MHYYKGPLTICCDGLLVWKQHALKLLKVDSANNSIQVPGEKEKENLYNMTHAILVTKHLHQYHTINLTNVWANLRKNLQIF